jgi:hypothetical protein
MSFNKLIPELQSLIFEYGNLDIENIPSFYYPIIRVVKNVKN